MTNSFVSGSWEVLLPEAAFQKNGLERVSRACGKLTAQPGARAVQAEGSADTRTPVPCGPGAQEWGRCLWGGGRRENQKPSARSLSAHDEPQESALPPSWKTQISLSVPRDTEYLTQDHAVREQESQGSTRGLELLVQFSTSPPMALQGLGRSGIVLTLPKPKE